MKEILNIEYLTDDKSVVSIQNHSQMTLVISVKPVKPKLKHRDFLMIPAKSFTILEYEIDFKTISLSFE